MLRRWCSSVWHEVHPVCMAEPQTAELCSAREPQTAVTLRADQDPKVSTRPRTPGRVFSGQGCTPGSRVGPLGKQQRSARLFLLRGGACPLEAVVPLPAKPQRGVNFR